MIIFEDKRQKRKRYKGVFPSQPKSSYTERRPILSSSPCSQELHHIPRPPHLCFLREDLGNQTPEDITIIQLPPKLSIRSATEPESCYSYHPFFLAKRLFKSAKTFGTLNWTYSRSRSSWPSFCISKRSSSLRSSSRSPRLRPIKH